MKITIDRDHCHTSLPFCERCFGTLVLYPLGVDRACIVALEQDDRDDLTIVMRSEGNEEVLVLDDELRELVARDGWTHYVHFNPRFFRV
jgi:hypothetical protein